MLASFALAAALLCFADHEVGKTYIVDCREPDIMLVAGAAEIATYREISDAVRYGKYDVWKRLARLGKAVELRVPFSDGSDLYCEGVTLIEVLPGRSQMPTLARVRVLSGENKGRLVYMRDEFLSERSEVEKRRAELARSFADKASGVDSGELTAALAAADGVAAKAKPGARQRVLQGERGRRLAELAVRHKLTGEQVYAIIRERGLDGR